MFLLSLLRLPITPVPEKLLSFAVKKTSTEDRGQTFGFCAVLCALTSGAFLAYT